MERHGYAFEVIAPSESAECGVCSGETPAELVGRLAWQKTADVADRAEVADAIVVGADTVAECCGQVLGKPKDRDHAERMLKLMSGRTHQVLTGVCVWDVPANRKLVEVESTTLTMSELPDDVLQPYLDTDDWIGKAGAFGFQDGLDWVRIESGSESNVVGLPMERLAKMLERLAAMESS